MCEKCKGTGVIRTFDPIDEDIPIEEADEEDFREEYCACAAGQMKERVDVAEHEAWCEKMKAQLKPGKSWDEFYDLYTDRVPFRYCDWFIDGCEKGEEECTCPPSQNPVN